MLTVITPTGARPEAFALCQRMLKRQTYKGPVHWIVVDDGAEPQQVKLKRKGWKVDVLRPQPFWKPGDNTQGRNLIAALKIADWSSVVTVWEDDDWYHADWLRWIADTAHEAELIGECGAIYYNVRARKWRRLQNTEHASLRCSAMHGGAIQTFAEILKDPYKYYDLRLWSRHDDKKVFEQKLTLGIKAMPGRPGIALGHEDHKGNHDPQCEMLRGLIGNDAEWYLKFSEENVMKSTQPIVVKPFRYGRKDYKPGDVFDAAKRLDIELHVHAKKVEIRQVEVDKPKRAPVKAAKLKVETQETKLAEASSEKEAEQEEATDEKELETEEKRSVFGRRGRKPQLSKDD